mmetsp:Transcript_30079/g.70042  ORF Transcript_30079/g.70042 Transcript_30079/m.70042 type:complete len:538 (-) Transcript_30079:736-2349(-)
MPAASDVVVVVDPYSTGGCFPPFLSARGFAVIALWTLECGDQAEHVPEECAEWKAKTGYKAEITELESLEATAAALKAEAGEARIAGMICGGESGVKVCDALAEYMQLPGNGTANGMENRRDKTVQQDSLRKTGVRAVRGVSGKVWKGEVEAFVASEPMPVVVKPVESAGSEGVKLCHSKEDAKAHFELLMNTQRVMGAAGAAVLVQEFLKGTEYVVDHVTKGGQHKTTMVWKYDKRPCNGAQFVYFGMEPVDPTSATAQALIQYTRCALNAIAITYGATHSEVMMTADGPCLVEVNCRCHGGNGAWLPLASALTGGYGQVSACIAAFFDADAWQSIPAVPPYPFKASGCNVMFVSYAEGKVLGCPGYEAIKGLSSFQSLDAAVAVGDVIPKTIDLFSQPGQCILIHEDPEVLAKDVKLIRTMESSNRMFQIEGMSPMLFGYSSPRSSVQTADSSQTPRETMKVRVSSRETMKVRVSMQDRMHGAKETAQLMTLKLEHELQLRAQREKYVKLVSALSASVGVLSVAFVAVVAALKKK